MLMKLKSQITNNLLKCRKLTMLFQTICLNFLIEQNHDNIIRNFNCNRSEFYLQRCEKSKYTLC